ncbi:MAG: hypothetical protein R3B48_02595 [Kofleriaceae bacterium]
MRPLSLLPLLALIGLLSHAEAAPRRRPPPATKQVAGVALPILRAEPAMDEGTFLARASSALGRAYHARLTAIELDDLARGELGVDALPAGLVLIKVHRDRRGAFYLYRPCDGGYHARTVITATDVWMLGTEPLRVPVRRSARRGRVTSLELDTSGKPAMAARLELHRSARAGFYQLGAGDGEAGAAGFEWLATPKAAAKLDVVVRICKTAKVPEFDFQEAGA